MTFIARLVGELVQSLRPRAQRGAVSIEYGVIAAFIAALLVIAVVFLGVATNQNFECVGAAYATSTSC